MGVPSGRIFVDLAACALVVAAVAGCASVDPAPFQQFAVSVQQLRDGADRALQANVTAATGRFLDKAVRSTGAGDHADLERLTLKISEDDDLRWESSSVPLFIESERFRHSVTDMNSIFLRYAQSLVQLSNPELISPAAFDGLTADLNANAHTAFMALGGEEPADGRFALFSTVGMRAARAYLENQRAGSLQEALVANRPAVEAFAESGRDAVDIAGMHAQQEYSERAAVLRSQVWKNGDQGQGPATEATRRTAIESLMELDRAYMARIETLRALRDAIGALPAAHRDLAAAVGKSEFNLASVVALLEEGKRLEAVYDKSFAKNAAATADANARAARARADGLQAEADAAGLRAQALRRRASRARTAAATEADPARAGKMRDEADTLDDRASRHEERAARLERQAAAADEAAGELEKAADEAGQVAAATGR